MARAGGTLVSRCLGCMNGVALLSEIHPAGVRYFNPLNQAHHWFQLLTPWDLEHIAQGSGLSFSDAIGLINQRCREQGKHLVLRDWGHLDFTAVPFLDTPSYRLTLADVLAGEFSVVHTAVVRHPADQKLSALCERLKIPFDSTYKARWSSYDKITGDPYRNATSQVIQPGKRKQIDAALDKELSVNPDYLRALQLLGYQHVDQAGRK